MCTSLSEDAESLVPLVENLFEVLRYAEALYVLPSRGSTLPNDCV